MVESALELLMLRDVKKGQLHIIQHSLGYLAKKGMMIVVVLPVPITVMMVSLQVLITVESMQLVTPHLIFVKMGSGTTQSHSGILVGEYM